MSKSLKSGLKTQIGSQIVGGAVNLLISGLKIYIGISTNCVSILSDGYNNAGDFIANAGGAAGLAVTAKKPSKKYPHGYGRAEQLVTLFMVTIYALVGIYFIYTSVERLFFHPPIIFSWLSFYLVLGTAVLKAALYFVYAYAERKAPSPIIKADKLDCVLDTVITSMTIAAYGASALTLFPIDAFFGILIGCFVVVSVIKLLIKTMRSLLGYDDGSISEEIFGTLERYNLKEFADSVVHIYGNRTEAVVFVDGAPDDETLHAVEAELEIKNIFVTFIKNDFDKSFDTNEKRM